VDKKLKPETKKKEVKNRGISRNGLINEGRVYINASFNNTIVTITDDRGSPLGWISCGRLGFKGTRKSTPYAAATTLETATDKIKSLGVRRVKVFIKGPGPGRDAALKVFGAKREIDIISISDITPIPHNGPRPPKKRRV